MKYHLDGPQFYGKSIFESVVGATISAVRNREDSNELYMGPSDWETLLQWLTVMHHRNWALKLNDGANAYIEIAIAGNTVCIHVDPDGDGVLEFVE